MELDRWWNRLFYRQWQSYETEDQRLNTISAEHVGWWILLAFAVSVLGSGALLWKKRAAIHELKNILVLFMVANILFVTFVGTMMDIGENNRFRSVIEPFLPILFVFFLRTGFSRLLTGKS